MTTTFMAKGSTFGATGESTMESGSITKWTAKECSPGLTAGSTLANTKKIKNMGTVSSYGPMEGNTRAAGVMGNSTVKVFMLVRMEKQRRESGSKESASGGLIECVYNI